MHDAEEPLGRLALTAALLALWPAATPAWAQVNVVVTTPDLKSIAEAVSGGAARVHSLIAPGADPEAFEPRPAHLVALREADLVVRVGAGYEHWLDRLIQQAGKPHLLPGGEGYLDASAGIALLEMRGRSVTITPGHAHGSANPHYWLDPVNGLAIAQRVAGALARLAPAQRPGIEAAHARFAAELRQRTVEWQKALEPYKGAPLVTYHNTWPYFARRFRLNIVEVIEQKEGVPPGVGRLAAVAKTMREKKVRAVVHEPFQPIDASRALGERTGARVVVLAPSVGSVAEASDYLKLFEFNVRGLASALAQ
ncbi:MAG: metal ABC transporter substrate-binding protein [Betaproteobacteria bacterium]